MEHLAQGSKTIYKGIAVALLCFGRNYLFLMLTPFYFDSSCTSLDATGLKPAGYRRAREYPVLVCEAIFHVERIRWMARLKKRMGQVRFTQTA